MTTQQHSAGGFNIDTAQGRVVILTNVSSQELNSGLSTFSTRAVRRVEQRNVNALAAANLKRGKRNKG
jgi:hypothetical protein